MHVMLAPGTHLLRRSRSQVQVGLGPAQAHRIDVPGPGRVGWDPTDPHAWSAVPAPVLSRLVEHGLASRDDRALREALPPADSPWPRHTLAALFRESPEAMPAAVARRRASEVTVTSFGHPISHSLACDLEEICRRSGLPLAADRAPGPPKHSAPTPQPVHVLVGAGEPRRELLDPLQRGGVPHLLVRLVEGVAVLGPFVEPGLTPCLRCLDAHRAAHDPAWPLLVEQYARASESDRADGVPEPVDAALAALAVAWAARDLSTYCSGGRPVTRGTTVRLPPRMETIETHAWPLHPACGCGWADDPPGTAPG